MEQEKQEYKSFQDLIGKYLVINGIEPGFKIEMVEQSPIDTSISIIHCEHNLILFMTDACIEMILEQNVTVVGGNTCSIREDPKDIEDLFDETKDLSHKDIEIWKQRWWETYYDFAKDNSRDWNERRIATNEFIERAMKEMNEFFKNK